MDLQTRLHDYEVTAVPAGRPSLAVVWSEAEPGPASDAEAGGLAVLDDYRITRVPVRRAS